MRTEHLKTVALALIVGLSLAQSASSAEDWKEIAPPPPPVYHKDGLITLDMPSTGTLKYGVDPETLSIGSDDVVRYVIVAYNPIGSVNAIYEGLRCETGEVKVYARSSEMGYWTLVQKPVWRLVDDSSATRHTLALGRQGVCSNGLSLATRNVKEMLQRLRNPSQFRN